MYICIYAKYLFCTFSHFRPGDEKNNSRAAAAAAAVVFVPARAPDDFFVSIVNLPEAYAFRHTLLTVCIRTVLRTSVWWACRKKKRNPRMTLPVLKNCYSVLCTILPHFASGTQNHASFKPYLVSYVPPESCFWFSLSLSLPPLL